MELEIKKTRRARFESRFEQLLWRFRLVTILPVVMSLLGSVSCFILGTQDEIQALNKLINGHLNSENSILLLGKVVGGIDYYVIGIALLIFGYGVYELIISDIDPRLQDLSQERRNILSITSLEGLKQKLTNVIIVALIVTAFKLMISFQVQSISELLQFCGCVLMLAFSALLVGKNHKEA
ncbi:YqhA family protein [Synechococcus sp. ROS8604]|uniref:YqhA family protein n=1 Tax=Synechococcus sp. ROS8604 TaxID=1442557 RepID=UPI00164902D2|nr:YqhA family protein [Synechococcus sp. ROS8604]QNI88926.1 hypothetical protein SynROS8604_02297 [Synechococcus sp. ROS8604]